MQDEGDRCYNLLFFAEQRWVLICTRSFWKSVSIKRRSTRRVNRSGAAGRSPNSWLAGRAAFPCARRYRRWCMAGGRLGTRTPLTGLTSAIAATLLLCCLATKVKSAILTIRPRDAGVHLAIGIRSANMLKWKPGTSGRRPGDASGVSDA
ncbi:hypothetical protein KCP73_13950 [Salmonella enterica subsp. enterica]|nr:hypothetical protein KCP73_13950 [Salmonella enterica subsp. enterica]